MAMFLSYIWSHIYDNFLHLPSDFNQQWLSPEYVSSFANAIRRKGAPLQNC